jgi:thiamine-phosphate diphosphorylase
VHLGQRSLGVAEVRRLAGPDLLIGVSVHSMAEVTEAVAGGVEYLTFGHVYPTRSHPDEPGRGIALLAEVVAAVAPVPVIAMGGITPERVPDVLRAGATGVAVMRSILNTDDVAAATKSFIDAINHHVYS